MDQNNQPIEPTVPADKTELIEHIKSCIVIMEQDEQDVELAQDMGLIIQGAISSSVFYATNSELQKINDTLAAYKDFNDVLKDQATVDQATVDATFEKFKVFLKSIPQYLAQVL